MPRATHDPEECSLQPSLSLGKVLSRSLKMSHSVFLLFFSVIVSRLSCTHTGKLFFFLKKKKSMYFSSFFFKFLTASLLIALSKRHRSPHNIWCLYRTSLDKMWWLNFGEQRFSLREQKTLKKNFSTSLVLFLQDLRTVIVFLFENHVKSRSGLLSCLTRWRSIVWCPV